MKPHLSNLTAFLLILACVATTCKPECPDCPESGKYPKEISFTEYSLTQTSCQWKNLPYDEKVLIINSSEELENYISCTKGDYPAIDFSKNSLLLASGYINNSVSELIIKNLKQVSSDIYILSVEIDLKYKDNTEPWSMVIMVDKLSDDCNLKLNLTLNAPKIIRPIIITDENTHWFFYNTLIDSYSSCLFSNIDYMKDTCILINSVNEFKQTSVCTDDLPEIDFDKYTLIIGKRIVDWSGLIFVEQKVIEDNVLTLLITKHFLQWGTDVVIARYHWGIYPKLPGKPFFVEYKYENE